MSCGIVELIRPCKFSLVSSCVHLELVSLSQNCCHTLSSGIKHNAFNRSHFSLLNPLSAARSRCLIPTVVEGSIRETASLPHSMGKIAKDRATWELILGLRYSGLSLPPGCSLYSAHFLYREDFLWSVRSRRSFVSERADSFGLTTKRCYFLKTHQYVS